MRACACASNLQAFERRFADGKVFIIINGRTDTHSREILLSSFSCAFASGVLSEIVITVRNPHNG